MNGFLKIFFLAVLGAMLWLTITASLDRGIFVALEALWPDLWFRATLADAYFSFLAVYFLVVWRERSTISRVLWFPVFMGLGSIGIAIYVLSKLFRNSKESSRGVAVFPLAGEGSHR